MYSHSAKVFVKRDFPFPRRTTPLPTAQYLFRLLESLLKRNSIPEGHCQVNITTFAFPAQDFKSQELLRQAFAYCNLFFLLALVFLTIQDFFMFISFPPLLSFWDARLSSISANTGERKANSSPPLRWRKISITPIPLLASGLFRPFSLWRPCSRDPIGCSRHGFGCFKNSEIPRQQGCHEWCFMIAIFLYPFGELVKQAESMNRVGI